MLDATPEEVIGLTDSSGNNARTLHYAAQKNKARVVKLLLNRKLDLAYKLNSDPLHIAASYAYGSSEAVVELLKQCPDVAEMVDGNGRNAFHVAITSGKLKMSNTRLHIAGSLTHIQSTLLLLKDRRVLNWDGQSARSLIEKRATTVSFAATFTMPGGYSQTEGTAIHGHKAAFKIFLISNTVAMCSSIIVVFCPTMWAWQARTSSFCSRRLTKVTFLAMLISFMAAVYITVAPIVRWIAYLVMAIIANTPVVVFRTLWEDM